MSEPLLNRAIPPHPDLIRVAGRLFWWESPEQALTNRLRFVAQVMNLGSWSDIKSVQQVMGESAFEEVLNQPPSGVFTPRRWNYWHLRLRKLPVPNLPRRFAA
jgi:hypothetical protein